MATNVVILGAGFGGLELATRLSDDLTDQVDVTLIDKNDSFMFGFSKLDVMFGRASMSSVQCQYSDIAKPSVRFKQETVLSIDPVQRHVVTNAGRYEADILVVALGADLDPGATPGLLEGGFEFYSPEGALEVSSVLSTFDSGVAVIAVLGPFFKCPPAPNEAALLLNEYLVRRGVRENIEIHVLSPLAIPIPISQDTSAAILSLLEERNITYWGGTTVTHLDPESKTAFISDGRTLAYDLFLGIPIHKAPSVVVDSGLTDEGWIAVDPTTFETKFPNVFAVGDITSAPVPRAGVIAEGEASTVADVIVAKLAGGADPAPYQGGAVCYVEMGDNTVARVDVNFMSGPGPTALFNPPSREIAEQKRQFGSSRRQRWFGYEDGTKP
jgi:sulfide:quinone oxidoreductase